MAAVRTLRHSGWRFPLSLGSLVALSVGAGLAAATNPALVALASFGVVLAICCVCSPASRIAVAFMSALWIPWLKVVALQVAGITLPQTVSVPSAAAFLLGTVALSELLHLTSHRSDRPAMGRARWLFPMLAFIGVLAYGSVVAIWMGDDTSSVVGQLQREVSYVTLGLVTALSARGERQIRSTAYILLVISLIIVCLVTLQMMSLYFHINLGTVTGIVLPSTDDQWWYSQAIYGPFASLGAISYGFGVVILVPPMLAYFLSRSEQRGVRLLAIAAALFLLATSFTTFSRGAAFGCSVAVLALSVMLGKWRPAIVLSLALAAVLLVVNLSTGQITALSSRGVVNYTAETRLSIWSTYLSQFGVADLLGHGLDSAPTITAAIGFDGSGGDERFQSIATPPTENQYMRSFIEEGVLGLVAMFILLTSLQRAVARGRRSTNAGVSAFSKGATAAILGASAMMLTGDSLFYDQTSSLFWSLAGVALALGVLGAGAARGPQRPFTEPSAILPTLATWV